MSEPFDPYSQWLGIEPHEMPVDHYRLLGIQRFENDSEVIAAAADERMALIRSFQMGPRATYTQKLLNELAAARVCLLNPGAKASYDQVLEAVFFTSSPEPQYAQIVTPTIVTKKAIKEHSPRSRLTAWVTVTTVIIALVVGAIAVFALRPRESMLTAASTKPSAPDRIGQELIELPEQEASSPILIYQEANGSVNLDASFAQLHGPTLRRGIAGNADVITNWESIDDGVSWTFKVVNLPPQGIFHIHVTYAARPESDGGQFVIAVGNQEKVCEVRGTGDAVTDEYFLAVPSSGEHTLTVRAKSKPAQRLMTLKSVTLAFP